MPVYVYRNLTTGETFEVEQRMTEPALVAAPVTGDPVKRLIQPVGIAFKGSGFYVNDSRSSAKRGAPTTPEAKGVDGAATPAAASGDAGTPAATPAAATSDAKPAAKPAAKSATAPAAAD